MRLSTFRRSVGGGERFLVAEITPYRASPCNGVFRLFEAIREILSIRSMGRFEFRKPRVLKYFDSNRCAPAVKLLRKGCAENVFIINHNYSILNNMRLTIKKLKSIRRIWVAALVVVAGTVFQTCGDKEDIAAVDNQKPVVTLDTDHIRTEPGRLFFIAGTVKDADGLESIRLENAGMFLDKTIRLREIYADSLLHQYRLNYKYTAGKDWTDADRFEVKITVTDVQGNTTEQVLTVTPDGDFTAPAFKVAPSKEITVLKQNSTLTFNCVATDNKALHHLKVEIPELSIADSLPANNVTEYRLTKVYTLPTTETSYTMTITAVDNFNNKVSATSTIHVSDMPDFAKMYLADVSNTAQLSSDLFGVPMLIEHTGVYQYRARYYNQKTGTRVRFIPQKTDFTPICFGISADNNAVFTSNPANAQPIVLNDVGYYQIDFNSVTGVYNVQKYTPTDAYFPQGQPMFLNGTSGDTQPYELSLAGAGLPGVGNWSTSNPLVLTQSATNRYLFYAEMTLTAGTVLEFTITPKHNWGWWPEPFYRFENGSPDSKENEYNTKNGGNNMSKVTVKSSGKYRFEFDTHLLRSKLYPID